MLLPFAAGIGLLMMLGGGGKAAPRGKVTLGPIRIIKTPTRVEPTTVTAPSQLQAPLAQQPSQGGGPGLAAPLSADVLSDQISSAAQSLPGPKTPGPNLATARRSAAAVANHLRRTSKATYDRRLVRQFQAHAGLVQDGLFGPATHGALVYFGAKNLPLPFTGSGSAPYVPPA